jgi:hypothetical protein
MVKLVDMPDLGSGAARRVGSSPIIRTEKASEKSEAFLFLGFRRILSLFEPYKFILAITKSLSKF